MTTLVALYLETVATDLAQTSTIQFAASRCTRSTFRIFPGASFEATYLKSLGIYIKTYNKYNKMDG